MSQPPDALPPVLIRVSTSGASGFQLRKGEEGISTFAIDAVSPPLTEEEILESFRAGSQTLTRTIQEIEAKGLIVVPTEGADVLPERLRQAHPEIRRGPGMTRS